MTKYESVRRAQRVVLTVRQTGWAASQPYAQDIAALWQEKAAANANFFNGIVHVLVQQTWAADDYYGELVATDFATFLAWREGVFEDPDVRDTFGAGLLISRDGMVLLGRQRPGNLNSGMTYPPGGFIDARDVSDTRCIGLVGSVAREVSEETGIDVSDLAQMPETLVAECGTIVAHGVCWRLALDGKEMVAIAKRHIDGSDNSELEDVVLIRRRDDLDRFRVPRYAQLLVNEVLGGSVDI